MIIRRGFSFLRIFSSLSPRKENIFCVFFFVKKCDKWYVQYVLVFFFFFTIQTEYLLENLVNDKFLRFYKTQKRI